MRNATLRQLEIFEAAARHLHYTRAAQELGMTQPSVSMQIRQLEDNLGVALFEQMGKRTYLTEAGKLLCLHCRTINHELLQAQTALDRLKGIQGGQLRIAIGATAKYFVPALLATFRCRYPGIVVDLHIGGRESMLTQIEANERDLIIMGEPPEDKTLVFEPFLDDPLVAVTTPDHPLAKLSSISAERLGMEPFLSRELTSTTRNVIDQYFIQQGVEPSICMIANSNEAIKRGALAGLGVAIVPQQSVTIEVAAGRLVILDVVGLPLQRSWYLIHRKEKRFSCLAEAFKTFVLLEARKFIGNRVTVSHESEPDSRSKLAKH